MPLSFQAVEELAQAVFASPGGRAMEAYSAPSVLPLEFRSAAELAAYLHKALERPKGDADLVIHYPDMGGDPQLERIEFAPGAVPGHTHRFAWRGWGLIHLQLSDGSGPRSRVASFSPQRAAQWNDTIVGIGDSDTWNWTAVQRHIRRLQRVLKKVA